MLGRQRFFLRMRGLSVQGEHGSISQTIVHNRKSLASSAPRSEQLFLSCMCVEDLPSARSLIIGCRNEEEVLLFRAYGLQDVSAIDLMSYSPLVRLGDMHSLPYSDSCFDFVFCAYTLSYSKTPRKAAREILRVARSGAAVAVAIEYCPWTRREEIQRSLLGYTLIPDEKLEDADDLLALFSPHVDKLFVRYDAERKRHHDVGGPVPNPSPIYVVFSVRK